MSDCSGNYNPVSITHDPCNKLRDIHAVNFGRAGGKTCRWRTKTCQRVCYGKTGTYVYKNVKPYFRRLEACARPEDFARGLMEPANVRAIRIGKVGDCPDYDTTLAIIEALKARNVPFMWPTRAWREPHGPVWKLIDEKLPGQVICSVDPDPGPTPAGWTDTPPRGYPLGFIAFPGPNSDYPTPGKFEWCHHYPKPGIGIQPICNCWECMLCYAPVGAHKGRPNIAFALHSGKHAKAHAVARQHMPESTARREWLAQQGRKPDLGMFGVNPRGEPVCGLLTADGWSAGDDDV